MYPYIRMAKELWKFRNAPPLGLFDAHISTHRIWPWDLDPWRELNNGRTLTLFDLGRIPMSVRMGFEKVAKANGWGITVAGNTTRYRKRVTVFQKLTQISRVVGWDDRFGYIEQSFWRGDECTNHMLLRYAFISKGRDGETGRGDRSTWLSHRKPGDARLDHRLDRRRCDAPLAAIAPLRVLARARFFRLDHRKPHKGAGAWQRNGSASGAGGFTTGPANPTTPCC